MGRDGRLVVGNEGRMTDRLAGQLSEVRREVVLLLELGAARDVPPRPHQGPAPLSPGGGR